MIPHIAVFAQVDRDLLTDERVESWCQAASAYLREDVWPVWGKELGVANPPNVVYYGRGLSMPEVVPGTAMIVIKPRSEDPTVGGFHLAIGKIPIGRAYLDGEVPDRTLLHEVCEMSGNAFLDAWYPGPNGLRYARELNDPTQMQDYTKVVNVLGVDMAVVCPNFVYPNYFKEGAPGPYDKMGFVDEPFKIPGGGYQIAQDAQERTLFISAGAAPFGEDKLDPLSRTNQIIRRKTVARV